MKYNTPLNIAHIILGSLRVSQAPRHPLTYWWRTTQAFSQGHNPSLDNTEWIQLEFGQALDCSFTIMDLE